MRRYRLYIAIAGLLWMTAAHPAFAQTGANCEEPIRLGKSYNDTIIGEETKWYVANTFDLPLTVRFYPDDNNAATPNILLDFGCTPGEYEDSIVCSMFCYGQEAYLRLPYEVNPGRYTDALGQVYYEVAMGEFYRDILISKGISYDIDVYIKAVFHGSGTISLIPDSVFSQCMDTEQWLLYDRPLQVAANDKETYFIAPYANWQYNNIRYVWSGAQTATLTIGTTCDFDPTDGTDERRVDVRSFKAGNDTVFLTSADIAYYIMTYMRKTNNAAKGGIFYVKVLSDGTGTLKVDCVPEIPPGGGATLLQYDMETAFSGDTTALYAIPNWWTSATRFDTPSERIFKMYIGLTPDFYTKDAIATCSFNRLDKGHWFGFTEAEMAALWAQTNEKYLYLRFRCVEKNTIVPTLWEPSECIENTKIIYGDTVLNVAGRSKVIHRFYLTDWIGGDMTVQWSKTTQIFMLLSGGCTIGTAEDGPEIIDSYKLAGPAYTIPQAAIERWADYADADGYVYVRFYTTYTSSGKMTISSTAPEEKDPVYPHATIYLVCLDDGSGVQIRVSTSQNISITDMKGTPLWQQTVLPDQPQDVSLPAGIYILQGEKEKIMISL